MGDWSALSAITRADREPHVTVMKTLLDAQSQMFPISVGQPAPPTGPGALAALLLAPAVCVSWVVAAAAAAAAEAAAGEYSDGIPSGILSCSGCYL
jgi:hypothetical protein